MRFEDRTSPREARRRFVPGIASSFREPAAAAPPEPVVGPPRKLHVEGLLFDMDDVLYDATVWRRWFLRLLTRAGLHTHYRAFYRVLDREYLVDVHCGRRDFWEALRHYLRSIGLDAALIGEIVAAGLARYTELTERVRPLPGVAATLAKLSTAGVKLGAINNSDRSAEDLVDTLDRLGLRTYLSTVVSSADLGAALPDPAGFRAALDAMSLAAHQVGFVGHDASDLAGARLVGMPTIAFNYDPGAVADVHLDSFDRLLSCIDGNQRQMTAG
jgi:putative hydrolase of the HAD superfamily